MRPSLACFLDSVLRVLIPSRMSLILISAVSRHDVQQSGLTSLPSVSTERPQSADHAQSLWRRGVSIHGRTFQLCWGSPAIILLCRLSCNRSPSATENPDTPSPLPDPASQLAAEAKELVEGACSGAATDTGTTKHDEGDMWRRGNGRS